MRTLIVVGPGERLEELAAALGGLLARAPEPRTRMIALEDLAQLLLMRAEAGRLLLDGDLVPAEDIGILRRFLEDRPGWTLHVVGDPEGPPSELLALPGSELLAWEPDLAVLRALAGGDAPRRASPGPAQAGPARPAQPGPARPAQPGPARPARTGPARPAPAAPPPAPRETNDDAACDLSALLDDLIVARALSDTGADYRFEPPGDLAVAATRAEVTAVLTGGLGLAEACSGTNGMIDVRAAADGSQARVEVSFPPGALTDGDLPTLLEGGKVEGPPALVAAARGASEAARLAADLSGSLGLDIARGKLRLELRLPLA